MNISAFSIRRPVTVVMIFGAICLFGAVMYTRLPVELMPNVSFKTISVNIQARGGIPPTEVESLITIPVEDAVSTVSNLESISSSSETGKCTVSLRFKPGTDMNFAALEVREKFAKVKNKLPKDIEKPVIAKYEESDVPILIIAVMGTTVQYTPEELRKMVESYIKERVSRVPGVANVDIGGGRENKILCDLDQGKMESYKLSMEEIVNKVGIQNVSLLAGEVQGETLETKIRTVGQFKNVEEIQDVIIKSIKSGSSIKLKDIAKVKDDYAEPQGYARVNAKSVVTLYVQRESTANTVQVVAGVMEALEKIKPLLPKNVRLLTVSNQAEFILEAISKVKEALLHGFFLTALVLYAFLRSFPSTIIIALSIPVSMLVTFGFMNFSGISLNVMTLSGLALGIGMLLDNSIVVLENIFKWREQGKDPMTSADGGANEVTLSIVAATATTIIVFLPIQFVSEQVKLLYGGLALTVTYALLASLFCAVALVPMLSARLKIHEGQEDTPPGKIQIFLRRWIAQWIGRIPVINQWLAPFIHPSERRPGIQPKGFGALFYEKYRKTLSFFLRYRYGMLLTVILIFLLSCLLSTRIEKDLSGEAEQDKFTIFVELPDGAKLELSDKVVKEVENLLAKMKEIKNIQSRVEGWSSKIYVTVVDEKQRDKSTAEIVDALRPQVSKMGKGQDAFIYFSSGQESGGKELYIDIYGYDYEILKKLASQIAKKFNSVDGLADTKIRITEGRPEYRLVVNKDKAALFGLTVKDIADEIHGKVRGLRASAFHTEGREVEIVARLDEPYRKNLQDILRLSVFNKAKDLIYIDQVVDYEPGLGPSEIWRNDKSRMIQVSSNVTCKLTMGGAIEKAREALKDIKFPREYYYEFGGNYEMMQKSQRQLYAAFLVAILLIYMVLASLFESYIQPMIILASVPLALIGDITALYVTGKPITMGVMVGAIMLAGIVASNAILLIGKVNQLREQNVSLFRSLLVAGGNRIRPILMTATCTELGLLPMALSRGGSSTLWSPLAMTVIGGLISGTILTLLVIPSIYCIVEDIRSFMHHFFSPEKKKKPAVAVT